MKILLQEEGKLVGGSRVCWYQGHGRFDEIYKPCIQYTGTTAVLCVPLPLGMDWGFLKQLPQTLHTYGRHTLTASHKTSRRRRRLPHARPDIRPLFLRRDFLDTISTGCRLSFYRRNIYTQIIHRKKGRLSDGFSSGTRQVEHELLENLHCKN